MVILKIYFKRMNGGYSLLICERSWDRSAGGSVIHSTKKYGERLLVDEWLNRSRHLRSGRYPGNQKDEPDLQQMTRGNFQEICKRKECAERGQYLQKDDE